MFICQIYTFFVHSKHTQKSLFEEWILKVRVTCKTNTTAHLTAKQITKKANIALNAIIETYDLYAMLYYTLVTV